METTLAALMQYQEGIVTQIDLDPLEALSLGRLGLIPGTAIYCRGVSPFGDPILYRFRGTDAALRRKSADKIKVQLLEANSKQSEKGGKTVWRIR